MYLFTSVLKLLVSAFILKLALSFIKFYWSNRWLFFYGSKFDGPLSLPLIGNAYYFFGSLKDFTNKAINLANSYPSVFRIWIAHYLFIVNSNPEEIEIILNKCLEKCSQYKIATFSLINSSTLIAPVHRWRKNRKIINPAFHPKIINSFQESFVKFSNVLVDELKQKNHSVPLEILPIVWSCTFEISFETMFDVNRKSNRNGNEMVSFLAHFVRGEEMCSEILFRAWICPKFLRRLTPIYKEIKLVFSKFYSLTNNIIDDKRSQKIDDELKKTRLLNQLITNESEISERELFEEAYLMLLASSETSAVTLSYLFLMFAIYPEIQEKVYEEVCSIFEDSERDADVEDLGKMEYSERVIKETMRLFPTIPIAGRYVDKDFKLGNHIYPKGSNIIIPIMYLHRSPKLWKDPLTFDPNRFLPEETQKRHKCAYIPFSSGPRNCPGSRYAMASMKTILSTFVRHFKVISCDYRSVEDINMVFNIVSKPSNGFKVVLEKRA